MTYFCCDERRRALVRDSKVVNGFDYNGIDFLEVVDIDAAVEADRQRILNVHFVKKLAVALTAGNVAITGGERITSIRVLSASIADDVLTIKVDRSGDYSTYTLRLVQDALHPEGDPPAGFDPAISSIDFSFKVECPSDFDCKPEHSCPPEEHEKIEIDYLAKDYNSFRQSMLDRMSVILPDWTERNAADVGIALVELLAYAGDHLSYRQDVIATEAYLDTARRRTSVRRHALLVDYVMHDGCNARTWVQVKPVKNGIPLPKGTRFVTTVEGLPKGFNPATTPDAAVRIAAAQAETFETMYPATLFTAHQEMEFYTWSNERCCLPAGSTSATLKGYFDKLHPGDVLIFVERVGPETGVPGDADPSHRHAVRLTVVKPDADPVLSQPLTKIEWNGEDALPFALCVSALFEGVLDSKVSVALGNIVLADHGRTVTQELLPVPDAVPALATAASRTGDRCAQEDPAPVPPRFEPSLDHRPVTQAAPTPAAKDPLLSAAAVFRWEMRDVLPAVSLLGSGRTWLPQRDLLSSDAFAEEFVGEVEDDGELTIRFGDDEYGMRPTPGVKFKATYRVGNGTRGNIGADSLGHVLIADGSVTEVRNPLPAQGGVEPESLEHVRRSAPSAFRIQERAVTPDDYAEVAERHREVQNAAATMRWTGSWRTVFLTIDRLGGRPVDAAFEKELRIHLERYRMAGHDVEIDGPQFVALEIEMTVCVAPSYFRGDVREALLRVFSSSIGPDGTRGFFHPDNYSFGQPVYLSAIYAAAQKVEGVRFVTVDKFQRLGLASRVALDDGSMTIGRLEIARLDNDPNFPERGVLRLTMEGGR